jgi:molybdopterin-guanine dinucleotide biosynthesis protein A
VTSERSSQSNARGYVMAGGASSRFGSDKACAVLNGQAMRTRISALLKDVTGDVTVVAPDGRYDSLGLRILSEPWPGQGPLGGIVAALSDARAKHQKDAWCLIVGCDMPFLSREWLAHLCETATHSPADVIVPQSPNGLEPLCACWNTRGMTALQAAFESGVRRVTEAMMRLRVEVLDEKDWKRFDSAGRLFWNMNTPADYEEAKRVLEAERE